MFCSKSVKWLYCLDTHYSWVSGYPVVEDLAFRDRTGVLRLLIERNGVITVMAGYAWNGCSPKFCFFDVLIGTPEGPVHEKTGRPKTYYASMVHDALYQFLPDGLPIGRREADANFYRLLAESDFAPRWIYWFFVRVFGGLIWMMTRWHRANRGNRLEIT